MTLGQVTTSVECSVRGCSNEGTVSVEKMLISTESSARDEFHRRALLVCGRCSEELIALYGWKRMGWDPASPPKRGDGQMYVLALSRPGAPASMIGVAVEGPKCLTERDALRVAQNLCQKMVDTVRRAKW